MSLTKGNTKWILFLSSSSDAEERHIWDIAFGLLCLEAAGISPKDIVIYVDGKNRNLISQIISNATRHTYEIKDSIIFFDDQKNNSHENMVMFVTGHGSIDGIDASPPITPFLLIKVIKESPKLECAVVYLGQCNAGIFNYVPAGKYKGSWVEHGPEVILVGATNLHNSLSKSTEENFLNGSVIWVANLFLLYIFKWITAPVDVDGDGQKTIIDSYKYAGVMSHGANKEIKISSFVSSLDLHKEWTTAKEEHEKDPSDLTIKLKFEASEQKYVNALDARYTHQECWVLNSIPAQKIEI
ncbi:hypothetical protein [Lysobacter hankyongensis]|uniref:Uncharacterized protein n=1 Tax=Lysobacter hankyongensis TaxID=1176535 RepID=A0ABP9B7C2_9GAMM